MPSLTPRLRLTHRRLIAVAAALSAAAASGLGAFAADSSGTLLPTDRVVHPAGRITPLDYFPTGAAISPDGTRAVAIAGGLIYGGAGTASAVDVIDTSTGAVLQSLHVGDAFQSVVYDAAGSTVYVAGGADDVVHVFSVGATGLLQAGSDLQVGGFVTSVALDGAHQALWAAESETGAAGAEAGQVVRIDLATGSTSSAIPAANADSLALTPDGSVLYATDWRGSDVTAIDTATGATRTIRVGEHPAGVAVLTDGTVVVADANDATLATIAPGADTATFTDLRQLGQASDSPSSIAVDKTGRLYVTLAGDDAVAVLSPSHGGRWNTDGLIPTGWYPTDVTVSADGSQLYIVTGKGLGQGPAATAGAAGSGAPDPEALSIDSAYATAGDLEALPVPSTEQLAAMTAQVHATVASAADTSASPVLGPHSPIKHVIYITRENKTYDADLGDLHPGPQNALVLFGQQVTPNLHALERGFVEAQNFTYPATASTTGHLWEDAGGTSDVFERANGDGNINDSWHDPTNYPRTGLLVEQVSRAHKSVRTYNEELAQQSGLLPASYQAPQSVFPNYDLHVSDEARVTGWRSEFDQFEARHCSGELAATYGAHCQLPSLEYVYLGEDHTTVVDEPGYPTIQAQVADNDYATAQVIDAVSHSPDWNSTLVVVVEDDPQGTGDDQSAYHGFIALASPWVKRGYISTVPYNLAGVVGAIDRILGLPPLTDYAQTSRPLDDLFVDADHVNTTPLVADPSGVQLYPFTPLPGTPPAADPAHGVYSFAEPDDTNPAITNQATWEQIHGTPRRH